MATASAWRSCRTSSAAIAASSTSVARPSSAAPASSSACRQACRSDARVAKGTGAAIWLFATRASLLQWGRAVQAFQLRGDLGEGAAQQLRIAEVVFAAHREEFLGRFGGVGIEQGAPAVVDLAHEGIVGLLEIAGPLALPGARQRRGAVEHAVQRVELVRH